jgi:beta-phosphoglucomutase-like phosphatase (HAD superfamily)
MTTPTPSHVALDAVIRQARNLVLELDGTLCTLYAHHPADQLRAILAASTAEIPAKIASSDDPLTVLAYAATVSPELASQAEAELTRQELTAAATAHPTGYSHDLVTSAREGNRTVAVISTCSADAVRAYLTGASLDEHVALVVARVSPHPVATWNDLISRTVVELNTDPGDCAVIAKSSALLESATVAGMPTISYAPAPATGELASAHADATVISLADLVLRLRASPLPK